MGGEKINLIEVTALKRSGHHAMYNWLILNLTGTAVDHWYGLTFISGAKAWASNDIKNDPEWKENLVKNALADPNITNPETLFVNYEDQQVGCSCFDKGVKGFEIVPQNKVYFIRDFYNNLLSRYKAASTGLLPEAHYEEKFIEMWKEHALNILNNPKQSLKYEDWMSNSEERGKFLKENFHLEERFYDPKVFGTVSSFSEGEKRDFSILPERIKTLVNQDQELEHLVEGLGYTYKKI